MHLLFALLVVANKKIKKAVLVSSWSGLTASVLGLLASGGHDLLEDRLFSSATIEKTDRVEWTIPRRIRDYELVIKYDLNRLSSENPEFSEIQELYDEYERRIRDLRDLSESLRREPEISSLLAYRARRDRYMAGTFALLIPTMILTLAGTNYISKKD